MFKKIVFLLSIMTILFSCSVPVNQENNLSSNEEKFNYQIEKNAALNSSGYHSAFDLYFDYYEYGPYGNPILGLNIKFFKNGKYETTKQIQSGYKQIMNIYWSGIDEGEWLAVLEDTTDGINYFRGRVEFKICKEKPQVTKTMNIATNNKKVIHYYSTKNQANVHYKKDNGSWTNVPGITMNKDYNNQDYFIVNIEDTNDITFCFNDNNGNWDSKNGINYYSENWEIWVKDGVVYDRIPSNKVYFNAIINRSQIEKDSQILEIRGNKYPLSWDKGIEIKDFTYGVYQNTYSTVMTIDGEFEYKFVIRDIATGRIIWETLPNNSNRYGKPNKDYYDLVTFR